MDTERVAQATALLLDEIHPGWRNDPHTAETPQRSARAWQEFIDYDAGRTSTAFEMEHSLDQLVAVTGIDVWSMCAHHLLPFSSTVSIAYLADTHVLGLSKFGRIAHEAAHALNTQEALVATIADAVEERVGRDVAVTATGQHLCMMMRGIKTPAHMTCSVMRGRFREEDALRAEFLALTR